MDAHDFSAISFALGFQHFSTPGTSTGKIRHGSNADIRSLLAIKRDRNVIAPPKVVPADFFDQLADVLKDAKPLPGEEAQYAQALALVAALQKDSALKAAAIDEATKTEHALSGH